VPEYWIIDVVKREVEIYSGPRDRAYEHVERVDITGTLRPRFAPEIAIAMTDLPWQIVS
jgi:Uma2 family endonuclease